MPAALESGRLQEGYGRPEVFPTSRFLSRRDTFMMTSECEVDRRCPLRGAVGGPLCIVSMYPERRPLGADIDKGITQMKKRPGGGWFLMPAALAVAVVFSLASLRAEAQEATVHIEVPATKVAADGEPFTVSVMVDGVTNLGAFQFELTYDPTVLMLVNAERGPFLGSSGRQVECLPPPTGKDLLRFTCVTLGAKPDGPNGSGVLTTVAFQPLAPGSSPLHFALLILTDPSAQPLPTRAQDATVTVSPAGESDDGGFAWALWGPIIGGVVLALVVAGAAAWWARRSQGP